MSRFWFSDGPLPFGEIRLWQPDYREFVCSRETAAWLMAGAMTHLDGVAVRLQVMDTLRGGFNVVVKAWPPVWQPENTFELEDQLVAEAEVAA